MCGIAGIVKLNSGERVQEAPVKRMTDTLYHRGPDDEGFWTDADGRVGFGHRRLAIIDVGGGRQPMTNEDGTCWVVYNGEIYNHLALRQRLEARGHRYRTKSDTETILHLYEEEGDHCVEFLQGMFAFAIWDVNRSRLLLARDRLGIKPLYYALNDGELIFASEIKAILAAGFRSVLNRAVLPEFLSTRYVSGGDTFFQGIRKLLPGRIMSWAPDEGFRERRYWQLAVKPEASNLTIQQWGEDLRARLKAVVQSHLMSDVPLGLFLSGGIDSSGLAALAASLVEDPINTFSVGFSDPDANELPYARLVAGSIRSKHHEIIVSPEEFFQALPNLIWHEDEPIAFPSSVPLYFVSKLAREHVKVVLTGEGADELFLGYPRYWMTAWNERAGNIYGRLVPGFLRQVIRQSVPRLPASVRRYAGRTFLARSLEARDLCYENFADFSETLQRQLLKEPSLIDARDPYAEQLLYHNEASGGALDRLDYVDLHTYLVELLMKQDQMSMAASIESRVPFLDHELVEYAATIPTPFKLDGFKTKIVLREALQPLIPKEILTRRKMGFPVPVGRWLRGPFGAILDEFVVGPRAIQRGLFNPSILRRLVDEHRSGLDRHNDRLWMLVNLELWQRVFIDGEDKTAVMQVQ